MLKIGFAYNLKDPSFKDTDTHAEYETVETIDAIDDVLAEMGEVVRLPCDRHFPELILKNRPDIVFNIAEGWGGRDRESFVPVMCSMLGIRCTGSDAVTLGITMDKAITKRIAVSAGVRTTDFRLYAEIPVTPPEFGFPVFVKPARDGSSRGIFFDALVQNMDSLIGKTEEIVQAYKQPALVEPYLYGRDFCVGILGNDSPVILRTCEVLLGHENSIPFFSYEYKRHDTDLLDMSPDLPAQTIREMEDMAQTLWNVLGCRDYARFDFRTDREDIPYLLEVNALPGLSSVSGILVKQAGASGISYDELIKKIMERIYPD